MKSKMLGALALFTLIGALFVMQSAATSTPTVDAAAGSIAAMNVGTCLTTDGSVFKGACDLVDDTNDWEVRDKIAEVSTLYATYAHDPKTSSSDAPRAILMDSDLLKISIADSDRDKRTGVLIRGASNGQDIAAIGDDDVEDTLGSIIRADLVAADGLGFPTSTTDVNGTADANDDENDIVFSSNDDGNDGIWLYQGHQSDGTPNTTSEVPSSGNYTLNFTRAGDIGTASAGTAPWQFAPGDFKVDDGAEVRFYGCVGASADTACNTITADTPAGREDDIKPLGNYLMVDEDASNGEASGNTAPWLGVNTSVPTGKKIIVLAIYYRTSDQEHLVGDEVYWTCPDVGGNKVSPTKERVGTPPASSWQCGYTDAASPGTKATPTDGATNVDYTPKERDGNLALQVEASSDGADRTANLYLRETKRFSGVYQGFLRLTDANGSTDSWGRAAKDGTGFSDSDADVAVLGVNSAPVTITYRDTAGGKQTLRIEIDRQPPTINITSPADGASSGDQSPDFAGTIEDTDSGLADNSFRLVVDNDVDNNGTNSDFALAGRAPAISATDVTGTGTGGLVTHMGEYAGYDTANDDVIGVTDASVLYNLGDDACQDVTPFLCHITAEAYDDGAVRGTFDDSVRLDLQSNGEDAEIRDMEYEIDFQAFVMDMAGNIGFSDSDPANPRFINDLGTAEDKRKKVTDSGYPNVLGYYSAHIIILDEKDPEIQDTESATGYYGRNSAGKPVPDRSSVMVVFDGPIAASSVSTSTFSVMLDDGSAASIVDHEVDGKFVFLKLGSELASDATPKIDIVNGEKVEDMAGNETFGREVNEFEAADGISPRLTVTLSGGSGSGTGDEGPTKLTKDKITVHVASDEPLAGAPTLNVVCSSLRWNRDTEATITENNVDSKHDIDDYVANRSGAFSGAPSKTTVDKPTITLPRSSNNDARGKTYEYTCHDNDDDNFGDDFQVTPLSTLTRPGENWEQTWQNQTGAAQKLNNGPVTVVAFGRDNSRYEDPAGDMQLENWGSASAEFTLDTMLVHPDPSGDVSKGGDLQPAPDGTSKEARPFVLIEFNEGTTVTLDSVELDNVEIADQFEQPDHNRFVYWPETLSQGEHEVEVEATDAAGNEASFSYEFETVARGDFVIGLNAGWNAISVPGDPVDTAIGSVFTNSAITTVIGWDTQGWRIAMRRDGVWESNEKYGALNEIRAKYGYWVKSDGFVRQAVALKGGTSRDAGGTPILISIPTEPGWNFVGVVDQDGDQTEDDFTETLKDTGNNAITAGEYLGSNYVRAYTWDATFSRFDVVRPDDTMTIGDGVWVYYPEGTGIAP